MNHWLQAESAFPPAGVHWVQIYPPLLRCGDLPSHSTCRSATLKGCRCSKLRWSPGPASRIHIMLYQLDLTAQRILEPENSNTLTGFQVGSLRVLWYLQQALSVAWNKVTIKIAAIITLTVYSAQHKVLYNLFNKRKVWYSLHSLHVRKMRPKVVNWL